MNHVNRGYIHRVSTDEQAQKGYSQRSQEDRLQKFCTSNHIEISRVIYEDYSAKTFRRPAWSGLMADFNRSKANRPNLILFTKWDMFSRNAADAYYMIGRLKKMEIQPSAIDQPLDLTIPENKIMLAIYLATSEVENDRRGLNIRQGIHKAKQEGRCTGHPPIGYKNITLIDGRKSIIINEPEAIPIRNIFEELAKGDQSAQAIYNNAVANGLKCSLNNFWLLIRNPIYCGKIIVPEYEKQKRHITKGIHEKLISEQLFEQVQQILIRKGKPQARNTLKSQLVLRNFLLCPICHKTLTGSTTVGRFRYYHYYHCSGGCRLRIRADLLNTLFVEELKILVPREEYISLFRIILKEVHKKRFGNAIDNQSGIFKIIEQTIDRLGKAKGLFLTGEIDNDDYTAIKSDCENRINKTGRDLQNTALSLSKVAMALDIVVARFSNMAKTFEESDVLVKRRIIRLVCERKIIYDGNRFIPFFTPVVKTVFGLGKNDPVDYETDKESIIKVTGEKISNSPKVYPTIPTSKNTNSEDKPFEYQTVKSLMNDISEILI